MATLEDIAKVASVSRQTVARVLAGETKATWASSAERVKKIRQIAKRLGYRPNAAARATAKGRFDSFALLLSTVDYRSQLPLELFDGIHDATRNTGRRLFVSRLSDEILTDERYVPGILNELCTDGLLINYTSDIPGRLIKLVREYAVPSVWINSKQETDCVHPDDFGAGERGAEYLLKVGHRRIAFVHYGPGWHYSSTDRRAGYEKAMKAAGLRAQVDSERYDDTMAAARRMLTAVDRPTAVIAYGGDEATILLVAAFSLGLRVPGDLSIVSLTLNSHSSLLGQMGGIGIPEQAVGEAAVEMLTRKLLEPDIELPTRVIPFGGFVGTITPPALGVVART